jgi:hypothetical protein
MLPAMGIKIVLPEGTIACQAFNFPNDDDDLGRLQILASNLYAVVVDVSRTRYIGDAVTFTEYGVVQAIP